MGNKARGSNWHSEDSAKVIPLRPPAGQPDRPTDDLAGLVGEIGGALADLIAMADKRKLELPEAVRHAARLLNEASSDGQAEKALAADTGLRLDAASSELWTQATANGAVLALIMTTDGRLALAPVSWSRRELLATGGAMLLGQLTGHPVESTDAAERLNYTLEHPRKVGMQTVTDLRERVHVLIANYDLAPSISLLSTAGQFHGHVASLREEASTDHVRRELRAIEAHSATLMGQLVWDASQRRDHATAITYYDQAVTAAQQVGDTVAEAYARLRKSYVALYGKQDPKAGLSLVQQAAELTGNGASHAVAGLSLLHAGEAYAMLKERQACDDALGAAESHFERVQSTDPGHSLFSQDQLGRVRGSCYLSLDEPAQAQQLLERTARSPQGRPKSKTIVLGNLALAFARQRDISQAAASLHHAMDLLEVTRGGGGLNVVCSAVRELRPWRAEPQVQDVNDRLLALLAHT